MILALTMIITVGLSWSTPSQASADQPGYGPQPPPTPSSTPASTWCVDGQPHSAYDLFYVTAGESITVTLTDAAGTVVASAHQSFGQDDDFVGIGVDTPAGLTAGTYTLHYVDQAETTYTDTVHAYNCMKITYVSCTQADFVNPDPYALAAVVIDQYSTDGFAYVTIKPGQSYRYTSVGDGDVDWSADDLNLGYSPFTPSLGSGTLEWPPCTLTRTPRPSVTGWPLVGHRLTVHAHVWQPAPVALSYRWLRDNQPIDGATTRTYRLTRSDRGHRIRVQVTGSKAGYPSVTRSSRPERVWN